MKAWGSVEIGPVATISTAHIDESNLKLLEKALEDKSISLDSDHWIEDMVWGCHPYGYMVTGHSLRRRLKENPDQTPKFLLEAGELARDLNLAWLVYDRDASELDGMTTYD